MWTWAWLILARRLAGHSSNMSGIGPGVDFSRGSWFVNDFPPVGAIMRTLASVLAFASSSTSTIMSPCLSFPNPVTCSSLKSCCMLSSGIVPASAAVRRGDCSLVNWVLAFFVNYHVLFPVFLPRGVGGLLELSSLLCFACWGRWGRLSASSPEGFSLGRGSPVRWLDAERGWSSPWGGCFVCCLGGGFVRFSQLLLTSSFFDLASYHSPSPFLPAGVPAADFVSAWCIPLGSLGRC